MRHLVFILSCASVCLHVGAARAQGAAPAAPAGPPPGAPYPGAGGAAAPPTGAAAFADTAPAPAPAPAPTPPPAYAPVQGPPPGYVPPPQMYAPPPAAEEVRTAWRPSDPGFILAIERMIGFYGIDGSGDAGGSDLGGTVFSLAGNSALGGALDPFAVPQLSAHGVVGSGFTLGGAIGYASASPTAKGEDLGSWSTFNIGPRIGFVATLTPSLAIWAKGGITHARVMIDGESTSTSCDSSGQCTTNTTKTTETIAFTDLSLDPMLVVFPIPHVALLFGPAIDIGLGGSVSSDSPGSPSTSVTLSNYGVSGGLAVFL